MKDKYKQRLSEFREYFLTKKKEYSYVFSNRCLIGFMEKFYKYKVKKRFDLVKFETYFCLVGCSYDIKFSKGKFKWSGNKLRFSSALNMLDRLIVGEFDRQIKEKIWKK